MYPWSPKFPLLSELDRMPCRGPPLSHGTGRRDARRADHHFHLRAAVYGQAEGEPGAPPGFALHSDGSGVLADNLVADGKTQPRADRKSTRLNSSHLVISYAVFCLKKKKINKNS